MELSFIPIWVVSMLFAVGCAVDALTWHPYEWHRAGASQILRLGVIAAPLFSLFCPLPGLVLGLIYLLLVRRNLRPGQHPVRRRPVLGLDWAWRSMGVGQQVKLVLSGAGAVAVELALFWFAPQPEEVPRWLNAVLIVLLWPTFLVLVYLMLTVLRHVIPIALASPGRASVQQRLDGLAGVEYRRRIEDFRQRHEPPPLWDRGRPGSPGRSWPPQGAPQDRGGSWPPQGPSQGPGSWPPQGSGNG